MTKSNTPTQYVTSTKLLKLGRLGNQLFIISAIAAYAKQHQAKALFPYWRYAQYLENPFPCIHPYVPTWGFTHLLPWNQYPETTPNIYTPINQTAKYLDLYGFFQSEKYFKPEETNIRKLFTPKPEIVESLLKKYQHILQKKPVSLHIRRGDYSEFGNTMSLSSDYYKKAVSQFDKSRHYLIFSDAPEWCRYHCRFLSQNLTIIQGQSEFEDIILMSMCKDHITANSTFSWWGAWLNPSTNKRVLTPKNWIFQPDISQTDVIPESWEVIS